MRLSEMDPREWAELKAYVRGKLVYIDEAPSWCQRESDEHQGGSDAADGDSMVETHRERAAVYKFPSRSNLRLRHVWI